MLSFLLPLLIFAQGSHTGAQDVARQSESLSFVSKRIEYQWNRIIPLDLTVDSLKIKTIFFNKREIARGVLSGAQFGTRARVEVENTSDKSRNPGFAVAVFDDKDNLIGVASGGSKIVVVRPGKTVTFDLNFFQVKERLQRGSYFVISVELAN